MRSTAGGSGESYKGPRPLEAPIRSRFRSRQRPRALLRATAAAVAALPLLAACGEGGGSESGSPSESPRPVLGADPAVDVDGDGFADFVFGGARYGATPYVAALLGGPAGLEPDRAVVRTRKSLGLPELPEEKEILGAELRAGPTADFDGDGFTDLLVWPEGSMVWGGPDGLAEQAVRMPWNADGARKDAASADTAVGDFDGDGAVDIAMMDMRYDTTPQRLDTKLVRGPVDRSGNPGSVEELPVPLTAAEFGSDELAPFDADGDQALDLMIRRSNDESPASHIVLASDTGGPVAERLKDTPPGHQAASGDFDGDGAADLLVSAHGVPNNENQLGEDDPELHPGYVDVYSGADGFSAGEPVRITRATPGVPGEAGDADGFGRTVLVADIQGDGYDDALVDPGATDHEGQRWGATLLMGSPEGVTEGTRVRLEPPARGRGAVFSWAPAEISDFDGDGFADLLMAEWHAGEDSSFSRFALYSGTEEGFAAKPQRFGTKGFADAGD